jgi:hypothetical protein
MMEGPGADSEEKHEPVSDIDTAVVVVGLKALDPEWPIREAIGGKSRHSWRMLKPTRMDPSRHFTTVNCRIAKGSRNPAYFLTLRFTADRGRAISRDALPGRLPVLLHGERAFILDLPT